MKGRAARYGKEAKGKKDIDRYGRIVALCRAQGKGLNGWMVSQGWALAYRAYALDYVDQEQEASAAERGTWGNFVAPWNWRRGMRLRAGVSQETACAIKGNISTKGERTYHLPSGAFYDGTGIDPSKGERWFCSEAEAQAAGWRRSKR